MSTDAGNVILNVKPDVSGFAAEMKAKLAPSIKAVETEMGKAINTSNRPWLTKLSGDANGAGDSFHDLGTEVKGASSSFFRLQPFLSLVKFPTMITGANLAAAAVNSLAAGALALIGALAPLGGLLATYPAILTSVAMGMGVVFLALGGSGSTGVTSALRLAAEGGIAYTDALKKLTPTQQDFVKTLVPFQAKLQALRDTASSNLLPALGDAITRMKADLPIVNQLVAGTATAVGQIATNFSKWAVNLHVMEDIKTIGQGNITLLSRIGQFVMGIVDGFRHILAAGQPLIKWVGTSLANVGQAFSDNMLNSRDSGGLVSFFQATKTAAKTVFPILSNLAKIIWVVLTAGRDLGQGMLKSFQKMTGGWLTFLQSSSGKSSLANFFSSAKAPLSAFAKLIGAIVKLFSDMAAKGQGGLTTFIDSIRTELLPVITTIVQGSSGKLGPAIIQIAKGFLRLFSIFGTESGGIISFLKLIGKLANGMANLFDQHPLIKRLATDMAAIIGIAGFVGAPGIIKETIAIAQWLATRKLANLQQAAANALTGQSTAMTYRQIIAEKLHAVWTKAVAAAQWLWNVAMSANPMILLVAAIAAVVAVIIVVLVKTGLLSKAWDWMKKTAVSAWNWVKSAAMKFWSWISPVVKAFVTLWKVQWKIISTVAKVIFHIVIGAAKMFWHAFKVIVKLIVNIWKVQWKIISTVAKVAWKIVEGAWRVATAFFKGLFRGILAVARPVWNGIKTVAIGVWRAMKAAWNGAKAFFSGIWDAVKNGAIDAWNAIASAWNNTIGSLSFRVPGWVPVLGGKGWDVPDIPMFAEGAIVSKPTLAMVGEGQGSEAIVPLGRGGKQMHVIVDNARDIGDLGSLASQMGRLGRMAR